MKFLLHENVGQATIQRIGDYLRSHGSGHHWFERYRGRIFIIVADDRDEALLRTRFPELVQERCDLDAEAFDPAKCLDVDPATDRDISREAARAQTAHGHGP